MKIEIIIGAWILIVLISGCGSEIEERIDNGNEKTVSTKDIVKCLSKPYDEEAWKNSNEQTIVVGFKEKSDEIINEIANNSNISLGVYHKSDNIIFMKFNVQDNLPVEKICNFLNSNKVDFHYPEMIDTTF